MKDGVFNQGSHGLTRKKAGENGDNAEAVFLGGFTCGVVKAEDVAPTAADGYGAGATLDRPALEGGVVHVHGFGLRGDCGP